jgi:predicted O-methyltransferase YrrM
MSNVIQEWIIDYLRESQATVDAELQEIGKRAHEQNLPIIEPEVGNLLNLLVKIFLVS